MRQLFNVCVSQFQLEIIIVAVHLYKFKMKHTLAAQHNVLFHELYILFYNVNVNR